jgi:phage shock protein E
MSFIILILLVALIYFAFKNNLLTLNIPEIKNLDMNNTLIVDVRTIEEWDEGHGKNTTHIPLHILPLKINELENFKNKKIIVVCRSGGRAGQAIQILQNAGFQNLENGGAWQNFA